MMQERPNPPSPAVAPAVEPAYGIREASASSLSCAACGHEVAGGGPVGHRGEEPLCDPCLLEGSPQLGMVLALVAVSRAYAAAARGEPEHYRELLEELGAFARVYECIAAKSGPRRAFHLPGAAPEDAVVPGEGSGEEAPAGTGETSTGPQNANR